MLWFTHLFFGLLFGLLGFKLLGVTVSPALLGLMALGGLFPDIDASDAKIKHLKIPLSAKRQDLYIKPFLPLSEGFHLIFGHRGAMHSLLALLLFAVFSLAGCHSLGGSGWLCLAFLLGYFSHLVADSLTKSGTPLLYPYKKTVGFLPKRIAFRTGSAAEVFLFIVLALFVALWLIRYEKSVISPLLVPSYET